MFTCPGLQMLCSLILRRLRHVQALQVTRKTVRRTQGAMAIGPYVSAGIDATESR
jgi:hypothetical protein